VGGVAAGHYGTVISGSAAANHRKDGEDIARGGSDSKVGVTGIEHEHTNLLPADCQLINNIAYGCCLVYFPFLNLEAIVAKKGEEFNGNVHYQVTVVKRAII
jgi:hypothetical protein